MIENVRRVYRQSLKPADSLFNLYLARPLAAVVVAALAPTRTTPNQVTFGSLVAMVVAMVALVGIAGPWGLVLGVVGVEFSYVLDCADGQLARVTGRSSTVGALLDFLMDELKAYLLVGAIAARWFLHEGGGGLATYAGLATLAVVGGALAMTKFIRTPEYAEATGTKLMKHGEAAGAARNAKKGPLWPVMAVARSISQYPTTLPLFALVDRLDIFLWAYGAVHLLYLGQTTLGIVLKLGRFAPKDA